MIGRIGIGICVAAALAGPALAELAMTGAPVIMRAAPSGKAQIVQRIPKSVEVELGTCARGWREASWRSRSGYIPCSAMIVGRPPATWEGTAMPPPVVNVAPTSAAPGPRWTGAYVGIKGGVGSSGW